MTAMNKPISRINPLVSLVLVWASACFVGRWLVDPFVKSVSQDVESMTHDVMVMLDVSKSMDVIDMKDGDLSISRLDYATWRIHEWGEAYPEFSFGLGLFAWSVEGVMPLTHDIELFLSFLSSVQQENILRQGTDVMWALEYGASRYASGSTDGWLLIVLTDGWEVEDMKEMEWLDIPSSLLPVLIWVWTPRGGPVPDYTTWSGAIVYKVSNGTSVISTINTEWLQQIANSLGGIYVDTQTPFDLKEIIKDAWIASQSSEISWTKNTWAWVLMIWVWWVLFLLYLMSLLFLPRDS